MLSKKHCWWAAEMRQQHRGKGSGHQGKAGPGAVLWTRMAEESQDTARDGQGSRHKPKRRQEKSNYKSTKMGPTLLMNICILAIVRPGTGRIAQIICVCRNPSKWIPAFRETMASQVPANDSPKRNSASQGLHLRWACVNAKLFRWRSHAIARDDQHPVGQMKPSRPN